MWMFFKYLQLSLIYSVGMKAYPFYNKVKLAYDAIRQELNME